MLAEHVCYLLLMLSISVDDIDIPSGGNNLLVDCRTIREIRGASKSVRFAKRDGVWAVASVDLGGFVSGPPAIEPITKLTSLDSLAIRGEKIRQFGGKSGDQWTNLRQLRRLKIDSRCFTAEFAEVVARLPNLERLDLSATSDRLGQQTAIANLRMLPGLKELDLRSLRISDGDLDRIASLHQLEVLDLRGHSDITDAGIVLLAGLTHLRELYLPFNLRHDSVLPILKTLTGLRLLDLGAVPVSASSSSVLKELPGLEVLKCTVGADSAGIDLSHLTHLTAMEFKGVRPVPRLPQSVRQLQIHHETLATVSVLTLPELESLDVRFDPFDAFTDVEIGAMAKFSNLRSLKLHGVSNVHLQAIPFARLQSLQQLELQHTGQCKRFFGDLGIKSLQPLTQLVSFKSDSLLLTDDGLSVLASFEKLQRLELSFGPDVTKSGMEHIWALKHLRQLHLGSIPDGYALDDLMQGLSTLVELEDLTVWGRFSEHDLSKLSPLKNLRRLNLPASDCFSDTGLAALIRAMPNLQEVTCFCVD